MADELSLFRVIITGEGGEFAYLADVVQKGDADEEVPFEERVAFTVEVAELGDPECVFTEAADKTVVYGFCRGRELEFPDKIFILYKKHLQELFQIGIFNGVYKLQDCLVHIVDIALGNRQIVGRVILTFVAQAGAADIELQMSLESDNLSRYVHVIHLAEFSDSHAVGIPDLGIDRTGLILEGQCFISLSGSCDKGLSLFAEINILYTASILQFTDITHYFSALFLIVINILKALRSTVQ